MAIEKCGYAAWNEALRETEIFLDPALIDGGVSDHGLLTGLADDDHAQYALLAGRAAGQSLALGQKISPLAVLDIDGLVAVAGASNLHTSGSSTTVTSTAAFGNVRVGATVTANSVSRFVVGKLSSSSITVNTAVDWDLGGVGYSFTYKNPLFALADEAADRLLVRANGDVILVSGQLLLPDGSAAAPSLSFASDSTYLGIYKGGGNTLSLIGILSFEDMGGNQKIQFNRGDQGRWVMGASTEFSWNDNDAPGAGSFPGDVRLFRDAANTLALKNGNNDQHVRIYGANGTYRDEGTISELLTIAAAASSTTTMSIPANAVVYGVSVRVTTVIPTAATFTVIGNTSTTAFNTAAVAVAAGSTDVGTQNCPYKNGAAQTIRITPDVQPADNTGRVRITIHYYFISAATS